MCSIRSFGKDCNQSLSQGLSELACSWSVKFRNGRIFPLIEFHIHWERVERMLGCTWSKKSARTLKFVTKKWGFGQFWFKFVGSGYFFDSMCTGRNARFKSFQIIVVYFGTKTQRRCIIGWKFVLAFLRSWFDLNWTELFHRQSFPTIGLIAWQYGSFTVIISLTDCSC